MTASAARSEPQVLPTPRRGPRGPGSPGAKPDGPRGLPVVGAAHILRKNHLEGVLEVVQNYGDVATYSIGRQAVYVVSHPDDIADVVLGKQHAFVKGALTHELSRALGRGLVTSEGRFWRRQRKIAAPSFTRRHIERFASTMVECAKHTRTEMTPGGRDVHPDMMNLTLQIVLQTVFGDAEVPDTGAVGRAVEVVMEQFHHVYLTWRRLLPPAFQGEALARMDEALAELDVIFYGIIRARRARGPQHVGDDMLGRLLAARDDEGLGMTDVQVRDEVATLFLAGHETTALALSFALMLLAEHPEVQARVIEEIDQVLQGRDATMEDFAKLPWCDAVFRESLRLYPPAYVFGREATEDVEIGGWVIPRGAQVIVPVWAIHRDARWYRDPLSFRPQRWLDGLASRLPKHTYVPFGGGARVCVGNHFAMLEGVLGLATLLQGVRVSADPEAKLDLMPSVTLRPRGGVRVRVHAR